MSRNVICNNSSSPALGFFGDVLALTRGEDGGGGGGAGVLPFLLPAFIKVYWTTKWNYA